MPYNKTEWVNQTSALGSGTKISAAKLNKIEHGIHKIYDMIANGEIGGGGGMGPDGEYYTKEQIDAIIKEVIKLTEGIEFTLDTWTLSEEDGIYKCRLNHGLSIKLKNINVSSYTMSGEIVHLSYKYINEDIIEFYTDEDTPVKVLVKQAFIDRDTLVQGVNFPVVEGGWALSDDNITYNYKLTHRLKVSRNALNVQFYNSDDETILLTYKYDTVNSIILSSDAPVNVDVVIKQVAEQSVDLPPDILDILNGLLSPKRYEITIADWTTGTEYKELIFNHSGELTLKDLAIRFYSPLGDSVYLDYEYVDNTTIKIYCDEALDLTIVINEKATYTRGGGYDVDLSDYYTKPEVDVKVKVITDELGLKANTKDLDKKVTKVPGKNLSTNDYSPTDKGIVLGLPTTHYTREEVNTKLATDHYTKTEVDAELDAFYTKAEIDAKFRDIKKKIDRLSVVCWESQVPGSTSITLVPSGIVDDVYTPIGPDSRFSMMKMECPYVYGIEDVNAAMHVDLATGTTYYIVQLRELISGYVHLRTELREIKPDGTVHATSITDSDNIWSYDASGDDKVDIEVDTAILKRPGDKHLYCCLVSNITRDGDRNYYGAIHSIRIIKFDPATRTIIYDERDSVTVDYPWGYLYGDSDFKFTKDYLHIVFAARYTKYKFTDKGYYFNKLRVFRFNVDTKDKLGIEIDDAKTGDDEPVALELTDGFIHVVSCEYNGEAMRLRKFAFDTLEKTYERLVEDRLPSSTAIYIYRPVGNLLFNGDFTFIQYESPYEDSYYYFTKLKASYSTVPDLDRGYRIWEQEPHDTSTVRPFGKYAGICRDEYWMHSGNNLIYAGICRGIAYTKTATIGAVTEESAKYIYVRVIKGTSNNSYYGSSDIVEWKRFRVPTDKYYDVMLSVAHNPNSKYIYITLGKTAAPTTDFESALTLSYVDTFKVDIGKDMPSGDVDIKEYWAYDTNTLYRNVNGEVVEITPTEHYLTLPDTFKFKTGHPIFTEQPWRVPVDTQPVF